ncbi:NAD(P)/FAD-dependent oxidoreductase [Streptomyces uncialis]|uniref:NAD(P)/FAD-dependent oxidoreductase n=1 Tax=Streptomyces uncialis TaxID=1048205 RepID=UPI003658C809
MNTPRNAVVAGASAAGLAAADGLREGGWEGTITVLGEEQHQPYDRTMLSKGLMAAHPGPPAALRTPEHLAQRDIDVRLGQAARGLDIDRRLVVTSEGEALPYDILVLATGSRARIMTTTDGRPLPVLRTVDDLARLRDTVSGGQPVTLVGAGLIGLEIAAALHARGHALTVIGDAALPLADSFGDGVARWLWDLHTSRGVVATLGRKVLAVSGRPGAYRVHLDDGTRHDTDIVLAGIGAVPCDEWLIGSGVRLRDGVLCDAAGRTNVPGVWAAGDLARTRTGTDDRATAFGHWTNAAEQGRNVGLNAARGEHTPYHGLRSFWTVQYGRTIRSLGTRRGGDRDETVEGDLASGEFVVLHSAPRGETLHAVTACGRDRSLRGYRKLLLAGASLSQARELAHRQRG